MTSFSIVMSPFLALILIAIIHRTRPVTTMPIAIALTAHFLLKGLLLLF